VLNIAVLLIHMVHMDFCSLRDPKVCYTMPEVLQHCCQKQTDSRKSNRPKSLLHYARSPVLLTSYRQQKCAWQAQPTSAWREHPLSCVCLPCCQDSFHWAGQLGHCPALLLEGTGSPAHTYKPSKGEAAGGGGAERPAPGCVITGIHTN